MSELSFGQIMRRNCEIDAQAGVMEFQGQWYDWAFLAETIDGLADIFREFQVPAGAEIAVVCRNRPHQVAAFCAVISSDRCATFSIILHHCITQIRQAAVCYALVLSISTAAGAAAVSS